MLKDLHNPWRLRQLSMLKRMDEERRFMEANPWLVDEKGPI